ncbi:hypothetical protein H5410_013108 [Solanum commersonii]|uniref:Uncharacterized protein n=1 Tax=Solanum commersonii TaxID=4109 RepID=A0A9J6AUI2_SOLCO|nr:hypothetical protein H5410_013108 [Solanum commersonii]
MLKSTFLYYPNTTKVLQRHFDIKTPKTSKSKLALIQGNGEIDDDVMDHNGVRWVKWRLASGCRLIRMYYKNLNVSSTK